MEDDEEKNFWFKAKRFGWGWYPATREGWIITAMFIVASLLVIRMNADTPELIVVHMGILVAALVVVAWRTGERPMLRWGRGPYECKACGLHYDDFLTAKVCERWCKDTKSCNIDIVKEAIENRLNNVKDP